MGEFYLPYHFIPLVRGGRRGDLRAEDFRQSKNLDSVRHDIYLDGTRSGVIECSVKAVSPIFVGHQKSEEQEEVLGYKIDSKPALPASSLRGLIASLAEAASGSAPRVLSQKVLGEPCYSFRKPMRKPLTAIGMLWKDGDSWKIEPVCLPLLHFDRSGHLRQDLDKWRRVFKEPVFRVFIGDKDWIRRPGDDPMDPAKKKWPMRTTAEPVHQFRVRRLSWKDVYPGDAPLRWKPEDDPQTVVAQDKERDSTVPQQWGLVRVLGCYETNANDEHIRKIPKNKEHELFLPYMKDRFRKLEAPASVIERFQQLADQMTRDSEGEESPRPFEPKDTRPGRTPFLKREDWETSRFKPQQGDLVFFDIDDSLRVTEIAYSSIWRDRVETLAGKAANAWSFFEKVDTELVPYHRQRNHITLAERVFGFVEEEKKGGGEARNGLRLKGRVRFSPGRASGEVRELPITKLKELSSPKPPSPALYFRVPKVENVYIPKSELKPGPHLPQGRKTYLHHSKAIEGNDEPWINRGEFVSKRHVKIRPWAKDSAWKFEIRFDNLNDIELGMLLYALSPCETYRHKIGMGKPLGLGSIQLTVQKVRVVDRQTRYSAAGWRAPRYEPAELNWRPVRDAFRSGMTAEIRAAIEELGDPSKLDARIPISYPRVLGQQNDEDLYQWFVSNDQEREVDRKVALQPLRPRILPLPQLRPPRNQ